MIRLRSLTLNDFKNVGHGQVVLSTMSSIEDMGKASEIIGLYGQNGSGKTSFIQALSVLKSLMSGEVLPNKATEYIAKGKESFELTVEYLALLGNDEELEDYILGIMEEAPLHQALICTYRVRVGLLPDDTPHVFSESLSCKDVVKGESAHEVFAWSAIRNTANADGIANDSNLSPAVSDLVKTAGSHWQFEPGNLAPQSHWQHIRSSFSSLVPKMESARIQAFQQGASPLFSPILMARYASVFSDPSHRVSKAASQGITRVLLPTVSISTACRIFATKSMVVLPTSHQGVLPLGYLPLASHEGARGDYVDNFMLLDINNDKPLPQRRVAELEHALNNVNEVLAEIVPGLEVKVRRLGTVAGNNGEVLERFDLVSVRGDVAVPLRNESEGIQKILSITSLLVDVHVNPSALVAIDELDSGVFEYLLGEILEAIASNGCGQLIFTAHNLRPLEVLSSTRIWFTTVDPQKRFVRAPGTRESNNLRKMYLRDIRLGGMRDEIYRPTSTLRIDSALHEAGMAMRDMRKSAGG